MAAQNPRKAAGRWSAGFLALGTLLNGCVTAYSPPRLTSDHPASPQAAEAPLPAASTVLVAEPVPRGAAAAGPGGAAGHAGHGMGGPASGKSMGSGGMEGMDHSKMPGMKSGGGMKGMDHGSMPGTTPSEPTRAVPAAAASGEREEVDHSNMPGMKPDTQPQGPATDKRPPADRAGLAEEMKKTSDEMKQMSDELKAKSDALKRTGAKPNDDPGAATSAPEAASEHQPHQP